MAPGRNPPGADLGEKAAIKRSSHGFRPIRVLGGNWPDICPRLLFGEDFRNDLLLGIA